MSSRKPKPREQNNTVEKFPSDDWPARAKRVAPTIEAAADRITMAGDILQFDDFFTAEEDHPYDEKAVEKRLTGPAEAIELLVQFRQQLAGLESFTAEVVEAAMRSFVEERDLKFGQLIHPLRVAVTGKAVGFGLFETLEILGQERCLQRIDKLLEHHGHGRAD